MNQYKKKGTLNLFFSLNYIKEVYTFCVVVVEMQLSGILIDVLNLKWVKISYNVKIKSKKGKNSTFLI